MEKKELRLSKIESIIATEGSLYIKNLAPMLGVSEMTIRRDIKELVSRASILNINGLLIHPGDAAFSSLVKNYELADENLTNQEEKAAIGKFAASLIHPGESVIFDTGTTVDYIARYVSPDISFDAFCITLNTFVRMSTSSNINLALAGGYYHPNTQLLLSDDAINFLKNIRANYVFLSAAGVHDRLGVSCANSYELPAKQTILKSSGRHILVCDSSKFGKIRSTYFCDFSDIDEIITDNKISSEWIETIQKKKIKLHIVEPQ